MPDYEIDFAPIEGGLVDPSSLKGELEQLLGLAFRAADRSGAYWMANWRGARVWLLTEPTDLGSFGAPCHILEVKAPDARLDLPLAQDIYRAIVADGRYRTILFADDIVIEATDVGQPPG